MLLPPSALDPHDRARYPRGPNGLAAYLADRVAELEEQKAACRTRDERRPINRQLHLCRDMLRWCKTRAGYVAAPQDLGLLESGEGERDLK